MPAPQASRTSAADPAIARRRPVQGRQPRPVRRVHVRAALQKRLHRTGGVVKKRRRVEWRAGMATEGHAAGGAGP